MRLYRIYAKPSGESAIEIREVPMSGPRPTSTTFCRPGDLIFAEDTKGKGHITRSLRDVRGFVHVAMPDDFDVRGWPLAE